MAVPERVSCFKLTEDDWYPSYQLDGYHKGVKNPKLVTLTFVQFHDGAGWRVCVWGGDDCGMELDFGPSLREDAWEEFLFLLGQPSINKAVLIKHGFKPA